MQLNHVNISVSYFIRNPFAPIYVNGYNIAVNLVMLIAFLFIMYDIKEFCLEIVPTLAILALT